MGSDVYSSYIPGICKNLEYVRHIPDICLTYDTIQIPDEVHSESTAELRRGSQARVGMLTASSGQGPATQ